jgi:hypothetical protein
LRKIEFSGSSDDCVNIEGSRLVEPDDGHVSHTRRTVAFSLTYFEDEAARKAGNNSGLLVLASYSLLGDGCWSMGIQPLGEDIAMPGDWIIRTRAASNTYSPILSIECPDDVVLNRFEPGSR